MQGRREPRDLLQVLVDTNTLMATQQGHRERWGERGEHGPGALPLSGSKGKVARVLKVYSSLGN